MYCVFQVFFSKYMNKINENKKTETKRKVGKSGFYAGVSATS